MILWKSNNSICKFADVRMCRYANGRVCECENEGLTQRAPKMHTKNTKVFILMLLQV